MDLKTNIQIIKDLFMKTYGEKIEYRYEYDHIFEIELYEHGIFEIKMSESNDKLEIVTKFRNDLRLFTKENSTDIVSCVANYIDNQIEDIKYQMNEYYKFIKSIIIKSNDYNFLDVRYDNFIHHCYIKNINNSTIIEIYPEFRLGKKQATANIYCNFMKNARTCYLIPDSNQIEEVFDTILFFVK